MTNETGTSLPPRLAPDRPFPPYAYVPGRNPHPTRDPAGHSHGKELETRDPPDPANWRACGDYLYGIDLFNHGYYWEAHEVWEGLWVACGRRGPTATYLQALINLAAAGFKVRWGNPRGVRANAQTAADLFASAARQLGSGGARYMGLDIRVLARWANDIAGRAPVDGNDGSSAGPVVFDFVLWPD